MDKSQHIERERLDKAVIYLAKILEVKYNPYAPEKVIHEAIKHLRANDNYPYPRPVPDWDNT